MCMKNVNTNVVFCDIVSNPNNLNVSLGNIGKKFHIFCENDQRKISQISMAVFISATESKNKQFLTSVNPDLVFVFKEIYEFKIRLTETISGSFKDLETFLIEPSKQSDSEGLCRDTFNYTQLCMFSDILLPKDEDKERFVIKMLIRHYDENRTKDEDWVVQSIHPIEFSTDPLN